VHRQRQHLAGEALGDRQAHDAVSEALVERLAVKRRRVEDRGLDAPLAQRRLQPVARIAAAAHPHRVLVPDVLPARQLARRDDATVTLSSAGSRAAFVRRAAVRASAGICAGPSAAISVMQ
jgi:hypothetical protein